MLFSFRKDFLDEFECPICCTLIFNGQDCIHCDETFCKTCIRLILTLFAIISNIRNVLNSFTIQTSRIFKPFILSNFPNKIKTSKVPRKLPFATFRMFHIRKYKRETFSNLLRTDNFKRSPRFSYMKN